jgi:hypothetical protein
MGGARIPAMISGGIFAAMILAVLIGNAIQQSGMVRNPGALETPVKIAFFALFCLFGFSLIPLIVKVVLGVQVALGNGNVGPIRAAIDHSWWIIAVLWLLMAAGLATALPAAIRQGFFGK